MFLLQACSFRCLHEHCMSNVAVQCHQDTTQQARSRQHRQLHPKNPSPTTRGSKAIGRYEPMGAVSANMIVFIGSPALNASYVCQQHRSHCTVCELVVSISYAIEALRWAKTTGKECASQSGRRHTLGKKQDAIKILGKAERSC